MAKTHKRTHRKRTSHRKKSVYKPASTVRAVSKRVSKLERTIETKYLINVSNFGADCQYGVWNSSFPSGLCQPFLLNGSTRGIADTGQHMGSDVQMCNLHMRLNLVGMPHQEGAIRVIIFKMKAPNGAFPIMFNSGGSPGNTFFPDTNPTVNAQYDTITSDFSTTFKVLYDKTHHMKGWGQSVPTDTNGESSWWQNDGGYPSKYLHLKIPLNCKATYENGNTGTYTDITRNSVWIVFCTDMVPDKNWEGTTIYPFVIGSHKIGIKDA